MILNNLGVISSQSTGIMLDGWSYGKLITVPANLIDANEQNIPIPVYLNEDNFDFSKCKPDGSDIRFTDKNLNPLKFERVEHGTVFAHYNVLIPFVSDLQDTEFYMWYGNENAYNTSIEAWQDMTGKQLTYNGNVRLVPNVAKFGKAGYFNGNSYITVPDSEDWNFGSGDFTIRFHLNLQSIAGSQMVLSQYQTGNTWYVEFRPTQNMIRFVAAVGGSTIAHYDFAYSPALGILKHYKLTRNGSTIALTEEGVALTPTITTPIGVSSMPNSTGVLHIGTYGFDLTEKLNGYLDELEIAKGIARTDGIPTEPYTADEYTKLLLHFDSAPFTDETGKTVTTYGDARPVRTAYADGARSAYWTGGGYLTTTGIKEVSTGASNFCIENKFVFSALPANNNGQYIYTKYLASPLTVFYISLQNNAGVYQLYVYMYNAGISLVVNWTPQLYKEYDITFEKNGNVYTLYVDGKAVGTTTSAADISYISNLQTTYFGCYPAGYYTAGYCLGTRVTKDTARYGGNYTVPDKYVVDSANVQYCTMYDTVYDQNYAMVQHMGDTLVDATGNGNNGTATGTTVVNTEFGKARSFNGTSDRILFPARDDKDLTLLTLLKVTTNAGAYSIIFEEDYSTLANGSTGLLKWEDGKFGYTRGGGAATSPLVYDNTSYNVVCGKSSVQNNIQKLFVNGDVVSTATPTTSHSTDGNVNLVMGVRRTINGNWANMTDVEVRRSSVIRSDAFIKAESLGLKNQLLTFENI